MCEPETETQREKVQGGRKEGRKKGRKYVRWKVGGRWKERMKKPMIEWKTSKKK